MTADHIDYDALEASIASFDQAHPTQGACQHERYWRQTLPALLAENERLREALTECGDYLAARTDFAMPAPESRRVHRLLLVARAALTPSPTQEPTDKVRVHAPNGTTYLVRREEPTNDR